MAAGVLPGRPGIPIRFSRPVASRSGASAIDLHGLADPKLVAALTNNSAFPAGSEYPFESIQIAAGNDITFDSGKGAVSFSASVDPRPGLGVYFDPTHLLRDAGIDQYEADSFALTIANTIYLLFMWGYDPSASAVGASALGAPSIVFGVDGASSNKFAVIKRLSGNSPAATAVADVLDSWTLPSLISKPDDLAPNTWLWAEIDGRFTASFGASYGYDFNWVREAKLVGLNGDIGLKIQLAIDVGVAIDVSSAFAVAVNREGPGIFRVRVFKRPKKGWQFAFNAAATVTPRTPELPQELDDFVLCTLDLHSQQLLKDLNDLKDWTSTQAPPPGALAGIDSRYLEQLLKSVYKDATGKAFDFEQAKSQVLCFLDTWHRLDSGVAGLIWKDISDKALVAMIADTCQQIANCSTAAEYAAFIDKNVSQPLFLSAAPGRWLESLASGAVVQPNDSAAAFTSLKTVAAAAARLVSEGSCEQATLRALHNWIDTRISLRAITKVVNSVDLTQLDGWVKAKLQKFLDTAGLSLFDVQKVQGTIKLLQGKASSLYEHTRRALVDNYTSAFSALYQCSPASDALLDVAFDFGAAGADPAALAPLVRAVIGGDFTAVLETPHAGVKFNRAVLTHQLQRHTHVEVRMPFYRSSFDEINQSLESADCVGSDGGRLLLRQVDADDDIGAITNRRGSFFHLGLAASLPPKLNARKYGPANSWYTYAYRAASTDMRRAQLQYQLEAHVDGQMGGAFESSEAAFETWLGDLNRAIGRMATDHYGHTLVELDLSLKTEAMRQWLSTPADEKSLVYMSLSLQLQRTGLKKLLPFSYFGDVEKYENRAAAYPLIVFSCIPAAVSVDRETLQPTYRDVYWDYTDRDLRHAMILRDTTREVVRAALSVISKRLAASGMTGEARRYAPDDAVIDEMLRSVLDDPKLLSLLQSEAQIVQGARAAGLAMAKFRAGGADPRTAVRAFAAWEADVTRTLSATNSIYGGNAVGSLSTLLLVAASASLGGQTHSPSALLRVGILKAGAVFDDTQFLQGTWPDKELLTLQQSIVRA